MRRDMKILLGTLVAGGTFLAAEHGREALSGLTTFHVREVDVTGATYVPEAEIVALLELRPNSSIWDDADVWVERVARHPMVRSVDVSRRFPAGLRVTVREREPVALVPTPTLEPVDAEGYRLPVDPSRHRLDLPVLATSTTPPRNASMFPPEVRALAAELGRMMSADTTFFQRVSELGWSADGSLRVSWTEPRVDFLLPPGASAVLLRQGLSALADAVSQRPTDPPEEIDLRFADQVVVRRTRD